MLGSIWFHCLFATVYKTGNSEKKVLANAVRPRPLPTRFANAWQNFVQKNIIYFIKKGDPQSICFSSLYCCCERRSLLLLLLLTRKHLIAFITISRFVCVCARACTSEWCGAYASNSVMKSICSWSLVWFGCAWVASLFMQLNNNVTETHLHTAKLNSIILFCYITS